MQKTFWDTLARPIIGLAPMDGITDATFRYMVCTHSRPSVIITEFTNVEGLARGAVKMLRAFAYHEKERPVVAQIYGVEVDSFYKATIMVAQLGFDGIDINMGCPVNKVARKGSGAALIRTPALAQTIVRTVQKAGQDWANGITLKEADIDEGIIAELKKMRPQTPKRRTLPVSIKTRIGYDDVVTESWIKTLLEVEPAAISLHGRTLKQLYTGRADWEEISRAARLAKATGTLLLGNGDIQTLKEAHEKIKTYGLDGVLVGRATWGNPWFFDDIHATTEQNLYEPVQDHDFVAKIQKFERKRRNATKLYQIDKARSDESFAAEFLNLQQKASILNRLNAAMQHGEYLETHFPEVHFAHLRKHLIWYCRDFPGAKELRGKLMQAGNSETVKKTITEFLETPPRIVEKT